MQMRIALARLLLGPAGQSASSGGQGGLLLLDEPTNHLDRYTPHSCVTPSTSPGHTVCVGVCIACQALPNLLTHWYDALVGKRILSI